MGSLGVGVAICIDQNGHVLYHAHFFPRFPLLFFFINSMHVFQTFNE